MKNSGQGDNYKQRGHKDLHAEAPLQRWMTSKRRDLLRGERGVN